MEDLELWERYLLEKSWSSYIRDWDFKIYKEVCESMSSTENMTEFYGCKFFDAEVMRGLLTEDEFKIWKLVTRR